MKKAILIKLLLFSILVNSQNSKIDFIRFEYNCSVIVYSDVEILIHETYENDDFYLVRVSYYEDREKVEKKYKIRSSEFDEIINHILNINNTEIIKDFSWGLDGATTKIEISNSMSNRISYEIWGLSEEDKNTNLRNFYLATELILKSARLKFSELK